MSKTTPERRAWLDAIKVGDLVCVAFGSRPKLVASITRRCRKWIGVERSSWSARTGVQAFVPSVLKSRLEPVTDEVHARLERARAWRCVDSRLHGNISTPVLHLFELILDWQHSPDVILAATERILDITKERMEARQ